MNGEENKCARSASKHCLLQAGIFRATGENQGPLLKKTHFMIISHFFCQICLLRSKIHTRVTNITAQEWNGSTCLVRDASTPLEITSRCHGNRCGNSWGWTCFQAVAGTNKLRKSLQKVNPEFHKSTLKAQRIKWRASSLKHSNSNVGKLGQKQKW